MIASPARDKFNARFLPYAAQSLAAWRMRYPLRRAVEPLPIDEQTVRANRAVETQQGAWDQCALEYLLSKAT